MLQPLATPADATAYGYPDVAPEWFARASTRVRRYLRQEITRGTSTAKLSGRGSWLLPQRPVIAVLSVAGKDGKPAGYELDGPVLTVSGCGPFTVEYDHGYEVIPDGVVELVCAIASRMAQMPDAVASGARTEQAGGEAVTWGAEAYRASSGLTDDEKDQLRDLFPLRPKRFVMRPSPPNQAW